MRATLWFTIILAFIGVSYLHAQANEPPVLTIRKGDKITVAVDRLPGDIGKILQRDLEIAGSFTIAPSASASYVLSANGSAGNFSGSVADRTGSTVLSKKYSGQPRHSVHQFADDIVETLIGRPGIATSKIAFVSTRSGAKEIYTCDYDGEGLQQLTRDNNISVGPSFSPDGRLLAYTGYKSGYADIYLVNTSNGSRNRIVKFPGTNTGPAFSPDSNRIACTVSKDGNPELYVLSASGGGARRLTKTRGVESSPTWSPDGSQIIYVSDDAGSPQLYQISASGGTPRRLPTGQRYNTEPNWSPDGKQVVFSTRQGGGFAVAIHDLTTGSTRVLNTGGSAEDPVWGANSRHIIFSQGSNLHLMDVVTGQKLVIVSGFGKVSEPTWTR